MAPVLRAFQGVGLPSTAQLIAQADLGQTLWLTTNFDDCIERALGEQPYAVLRSRTAMADSAQLRGTDDVIVKLHGDADSDAADLGANIDQILQEFPRSVTDAIVSACVGCHLVLIGYSCSDPDLIELVGELIKGARKVSWVGRSALQGEAARLAALADDLTEYHNGAPAALEDMFGQTAPAATRDDAQWQRQVVEVMAQIEPNAVAHIAAELLLATNPTWADLQRVHGAIDEATDDDHLLMLQRNLEVALREPDSEQNKLKSIKANILGITRHAEDSTVATRGLLALASAALRTDEGAAISAEYLEEALDLAKKDNDIDVAVRSLLNLAWVRINQRNDEQEVLPLLLEGEELAEAHGLKTLVAEARMRRAILMMRLNDADGALALLEEIREVFDAIGEPRKRLVFNVNLGEAQRKAGRFSECINTCEKVIEQATIVGDDEVIMNVRGNLSLAYGAIGDMANALACLEESEKRARAREGAGEVSCNALYNHGWLSMLVEQWSEAAEWFAKAAAAYRAHGFEDRDHAARALQAWCDHRAGHSNRARETMKTVRPSSGFRASWDLADFALKVAAFDEATLAAIQERFAEAPEERCFLLLWGVGQMTVGAGRSRWTEAAVRAAGEARMPVLERLAGR